MLSEHGGLCRWAHETESNCILNLGRAEGCVPGGSDALTPQRASEAQPVASNFSTLCLGWCLVNLDSGGPCLSTEVCSGMFHSRPAPFSISMWTGLTHPPCPSPTRSPSALQVLCVFMKLRAQLQRWPPFVLLQSCEQVPKRKHSLMSGG